MRVTCLANFALLVNDLNSTFHKISVTKSGYCRSIKGNCTPDSWGDPFATRAIDFQCRRINISVPENEHPPRPGLVGSLFISQTAASHFNAGMASAQLIVLITGGTAIEDRDKREADESVPRCQSGHRV